jgi:hypothetical protein
MVARADVGEHGARRGAGRQRAGGEHVVDSPSDVPLPKVAPRRPPREHRLVLRRQRPADVHEALAEQAIEQRPLLGPLADGARLAFLRVKVLVGVRHVEVAADDQWRTRAPRFTRPRHELLEEPHLGREVLSAVRHVHRRHPDVGELHGQHPRLEVERWMHEARRLRRQRLLHEDRDARVAAVTVPPAPVAFRLEQQRRQLIGPRLDLLQADDVGRVTGDPVDHLSGTRADAVHVPRRDSERVGRSRRGRGGRGGLGLHDATSVEQD